MISNFLKYDAVIRCRASCCRSQSFSRFESHAKLCMHRDGLSMAYSIFHSCMFMLVTLVFILEQSNMIYDAEIRSLFPHFYLLTKADRCYHVHSTVLHMSSRLNSQDTVDTFILDFLVMALDSVASFKARLVELNLPQGHIDAFEARRVSTFANFAFIAPYQPSSSDEAPFVQALKDVLGVEPGDFLPTYRRLFYESHAMAVQELRQKLDVRDGQEPRKLAMPERMERLNRLKASLTGLTLDAQLEPSHALVDRIVAMAEEQSIYYVDLSLCTSRESEVNMLKKEPALEFTSDGSIRLSKKHPEAAADTTGELRVRLCVQRRALAFQIANIATFVTLDAFIAKLFSLLTKKPISGYRTVSLAQIIAADQALWQKVSQETRGKILTSGDPKPVDKAVSDFMDAAEVTYHLLPVRDHGKADPPIRDPKPPKKPPKNPDRKPAGGDRDAKAPKVDIPDGCVSKNDSNQNICFAFNRKACPVRGFKCRRGLHVCWRKNCFGKHAFPDCPKGKSDE